MRDANAVGLGVLIRALRRHDPIPRHQLEPGLQQRLAANGMSFHGELTTLIVTQEQSLPAELLHQNLNLSVLEFDDLLLAFIHKAADIGPRNLPRLE